MKKLLAIPVLWLLIFAGGNRPVEKPLITRRAIHEDYQKSSNDMIVTFIDVGQGNAVLVESPTGEILLYDAGGTPEWSKSSWDPGMEIVVPYIGNKGIERVHYAVMSHAHGDHIGGFKAVIYNFDIDLFLDPGFVYTTQIYNNLLNAIKLKKINYALMKAGDGANINLGTGIVCKVFNPPGDFFFQGTNSDCNNSSVLLKIKYQNVSFLFPGDIEEQGEIYCVKKYGSELEANILQVGHHGSYTSSTKPFLSKVLPEVAVIPVGKNNVFGHPFPETLSNLESIGARIYRTDYDGNVVVYTDGKTFIVETGN